MYSTRAANAARRAPAKQDCSVKQKNGANYRNRTDDLLITSELLYRLSYIGIKTFYTIIQQRNIANFEGWKICFFLFLC